MRQEKGINLRLVVAFIVFTLSSGFCLAATQLDPTFGDLGFVVKDFGLGDDEVYGLAVQDDGKIIAAGYSNNGAVNNLAVARYLPNGDLDQDFNGQGIITLSMGSGDTEARSLVVQPDGKIVITGSTDDGGSNIAVVRLTAEGNLDSSFGVDGQLMVPVEDGEVKTGEVQILPDGSIIVAGTILVDSSLDQSFFVKIKSQGELDETFGSDGLALINQEPYGIQITTFVLLDGGKFLAGGSIVEDSGAEAFLIRLNENGSIDELYGIEGGSLLSIEGTGSAVNDMLLVKDGAVLVAGYVDNGNYPEAFVGMVAEDGSFVSDFGESGLYRSTLPYENVANGVALQEEGSILVAGYADAGTGKDLFLMSVEESSQTLSGLQQIVALSEQNQAAPDDSESSDISSKEQPVNQSVELTSTYVATDVASNDDRGYAIALSSDGSVFTAGSSGNGSDLDFAVLSFSSVAVGTSSAYGNILNGVNSAGFSFKTEPVTDVTRVGAVSGGRIHKISDLSCQTCISECIEDAEDPIAGAVSCEEDTCFTTCLTVVSRGVTYSVYKNPIFREVSDDTVVVSPADGDIISDENFFMYDTVRSGQTGDGSGLGDYGSDIVEITPDTTYFVRAYAVLSDDTVIYGNQFTFKTRDACFIATAAYGSLLDKHVVILREFRDKVLLGDRLGERFVGMYYQFSPSIAGVIEQNELLRATVRIILLPVVFVAFFILKTTLAIKLILLSATVGLGLLVSKFLRKAQVSSI